jgi:hypothetical protein
MRKIRAWQARQGRKRPRAPKKQQEIDKTISEINIWSKIKARPRSSLPRHFEAQTEATSSGFKPG